MEKEKAIVAGVMPDVLGITPQKEVVIKYDNSSGTWSMRLGNLHPEEALFKRSDLKRFLEAHVRAYKERIAKGDKGEHLAYISVDGKDIYISRKEQFKRLENEKREKTLILDTETTGFEKDDEVLQLSAVNGNGKAVYNRYFRPNHKKSWESAEAVNHISPDSTKDKPSLMEHKAEIEKMLRDASLIVGYNTGFDMKMLEQNGIRIPKDKRYVDLMIPFAEVKGEINKYGKPKWQKLVTCAKEYGYSGNASQWHNSMGDVMATLYCYQKMKQKGHLSEKDIHDPGHLVGYNSEERDKVMGKSKGIHRKDSCGLER